MIALRTIDLRNDFKRVSNLVYSGEKVLIARPRNENLIILSEREYNELNKKQNNNYSIINSDNAVQVAEENSIYFTIEEVNSMALMSKNELQKFLAEKKSKHQGNPDELPVSSLKGILKDKVWMADDFNEPLEEMNDYM